jgi:hypothetical protein
LAETGESLTSLMLPLSKDFGNAALERYVRFTSTPGGHPTGQRQVKALQP